MEADRLDVIGFPTKATKLTGSKRLQEEGVNMNVNLHETFTYDSRQESFRSSVVPQEDQSGNSDRILDARDSPPSPPSRGRGVTFSSRLIRSRSVDRNIMSVSSSAANKGSILSTHANAKHPGRAPHKHELTVFERLSNTQTVASIHRRLVSKEMIRAKRPISAPALRTPDKPKHEFTVKDNAHAHAQHKKKPSSLNFKILPNASFERLAKKHTKLSKSRWRRPRNDDECNHNNNNTNTNNAFSRPATMPPVRRRSHLSIPKAAAQNTSTGRMMRLERWKSASNAQMDSERKEYIAEKRSVYDDIYDLDSIGGPPLFIECSMRNKVFFTNTYQPQDGYDEIETDDYGLEQYLQRYKSGKLLAKETASVIFRTFFIHDLSYNVEWDVNTPLERDLGLPLGEVGYSFFIEARERRKSEGGGEDELKENSSKSEFCASAMGNIIFIHDLAEIHVENYSFFHERRS